MRPYGEGAPEPESIVFASYRAAQHSVAAAAGAKPQDHAVESVLHSLRELTSKGAAFSEAADAVLAEAAGAHKAGSYARPLFSST